MFNVTSQFFTTDIILLSADSLLFLSIAYIDFILGNQSAIILHVLLHVLSM